MKEGEKEREGGRATPFEAFAKRTIELRKNFPILDDSGQTIYIRGHSSTKSSFAIRCETILFSLSLSFLNAVFILSADLIGGV